MMMPPALPHPKKASAFPKPSNSGPPLASPTVSSTQLKQNLWDSILNSVSTRRPIPSGNVLILGEPSAGKSTLGNAILRRSAEAKDARFVDAAEGFTKNDFALGHRWENVKEEDEEVSDASHLTLVLQFLPPRTALPRNLAVIVLDWTKPWTFVLWATNDSSREVQAVREEGHGRLKSQIQHYVEPNSASPPLEGLTTVTSSINSTLLPLGDGSLTHNVAGVLIVVVCTKADLIDEEENVGLGTVKGKGGEWEEKTDAVMQVLRTISLQYSAALFYTTPQPNTLSTLRRYVLHFLFKLPLLLPDSPLLAYPFLFTSTPTTLDRDRILVPAGWDSWGKIAVLMDGFDASRSEAWERDLNADGEQELPRGGARALFREIIGEDTNCPLPAMVTTDPEQSFLQHHFDLLSKDRDPHQQFRQPPPSSASAADGGAEDGYGSYGRGLGAGEAQRDALQSFFTTLLQSKTAGSPASPSSPLPAVRGISAGSRSRTTSQTTSGAGGNAPAGGKGES
ncbi:hypothetical protein DL93DRAFT_2127394 [Clavulina sp. PMI_390]|nr:hypothetical protein DL93DRAFT_2127394 [Clavulina sp. PMI_390]